MPGSRKKKAQGPPSRPQRIRIFSHPGGQIQQSPPSVFFPSPDLMTIQRVPDRVLKDALHSLSTKHENLARLSPFFALKAWPASGLQPQTCHSLFTSFCWIRLYFILLSPLCTLLSPSSLHPCPSPPPSPSTPQFLHPHTKSNRSVWEFLYSPHVPCPHPGLFSLLLKSGSKKLAATEKGLGIQEQNCLLLWLATASWTPES